MEIKSTSTSPSTIVYGKQTLQKLPSDIKKSVDVSTKATGSAPSDKQAISTEDKYEKECNDTDKKEEFFDNLPHLRSMEHKVVKNNEKTEVEKKPHSDEEKKKALLSSILSVPKDALKKAKSAINKLNSLENKFVKDAGKNEEGSDPLSIIYNASMEEPEDKKKLWDNLYVLTSQPLPATKKIAE